MSVGTKTEKKLKITKHIRQYGRVGKVPNNSVWRVITLVGSSPTAVVMRKKCKRREILTIVYQVVHACSYEKIIKKGGIIHNWFSIRTCTASKIHDTEGVCKIV